MNTARKEERYTSDEFLAMTDLVGRFELIDGYIYDMSPAPSIIHQKMSSGLNTEIRNYITAHKGKCSVFAAPTDVKLDDENTVQPDILVVCDPNKLDEHKCNGAPDWVIEIVSPSSSRRDTVEKVALYAKAGVREYWIVFPKEEQVIVYLFTEPNLTGIYPFDADIPVGIYKDEPEPLTIRIRDII